MTITRFSIGDRGPAITEIRDHLIRLGLLSESSDQFDDQMFVAVKNFQQQRGLSVDGIVGPETWRRLDEAVWALGDRVLSYQVGNLIHGDDVAQLQQRLTQLGFSPGNVDGIFGKRTEKAVKEFQRAIGAVDDGLVGVATIQGLNRLNRTVAGGNATALREKVKHENKRTGIANKTIVLDIGTDPFIDKYLADQAVAIASKVVKLIEGKLSALGTNVLLTHSGDGRPSTITRADFANESSADLVLSVQIGVADDAATEGVIGSYFAGTHGYSLLGKEFAQLLVAEILDGTNFNYGNVVGKSWPLLRATVMPAVRIDLGFITAAADRELLTDSQTLADSAEATVSALTKFFAPLN
ncbi:MAG: peptidoglycan-binding protein [Candidatus Nanopelagicales bacterium]